MTTHTTAAEMNLIRSALFLALSSPKSLPFSFSIDSRAFSGIPDNWPCETSLRRINANIVEKEYFSRVPNSPLTLSVQTTQYLDFPVYEWTVYFKNCGNAPSEIISDFLAIDAELPLENPSLWHNNGDFCSAEGYETVRTPLSGTNFSIACAGGRPCNKAFPYFRLTGENYGYNLAIGWPGQWSASFEATASCVRVKAGQELFRARLLPGETVRSPRITVTAFEGNCERGVNVWRRWYIAHVLPRVNGEPLASKNFVYNPGDGVEFTGADEQNQLNAIETFIARGFKPDIWWIDAGWYPCKNPDGTVDWHITGNWFPDSERFPRGLEPIGKLCEKNGIEFLLWFEPERVWINNESIIPKEYVLHVNPRPETGKESKNGLLWLGSDAAREWLTAHVDRMIKENRIKIYRQDFNFDPLKYWRGNDAPEREGMNENLHVQGYLRYFDDLLGKNPGLWIDSCASGGRRNDLETMRRSVPLHPSDYGYGNHPVKQAFYNALYSWIPYFRGFTSSCDDENGDYPDKNKPWHPVDNYCLHNAFAPVAGSAVRSTSSDAALAYLKLYESIRKRAADYIIKGDFYALTPVNKSSADWYAVQFHDEDSGSGVVEAIRNVKCEKGSVTLKLRAIDSERNYIFESPEFGKNVEISGRELEKSGFTVSLPKRTGETWFYRPVNTI